MEEDIVNGIEGPGGAEYGIDEGNLPDPFISLARHYGISLSEVEHHMPMESRSWVSRLLGMFQVEFHFRSEYNFEHLLGLELISTSA